jgi:hypothetical protein
VATPPHVHIDPPHRRPPALQPGVAKPERKDFLSK